MVPSNVVKKMVFENVLKQLLYFMWKKDEPNKCYFDFNMAILTYHSLTFNLFDKMHFSFGNFSALIPCYGLLVYLEFEHIIDQSCGFGIHVLTNFYWEKFSMSHSKSLAQLPEHTGLWHFTGLINFPFHGVIHKQGSVSQRINYLLWCETVPKLVTCQCQSQCQAFFCLKYKYNALVPPLYVYMSGQKLTLFKVSVTRKQKDTINVK
jgi:hypothetical protein